MKQITLDYETNNSLLLNKLHLIMKLITLDYETNYT